MDERPEKIRNNKKYVWIETLGTVFVVIGIVLLHKAPNAVVAAIFVAAAILYLIAAVHNFSTVKKERAAVEVMEEELEEEAEERNENS